MSNDGLSEHAKLRERFAVAILQGRSGYGDVGTPESVFNEAQAFTDEAMKRRGDDQPDTNEAVKRREQDNAKRLADGAEVMAEEYVDDEDDEVNG
jgi:hypothetical protein